MCANCDQLFMHIGERWKVLNGLEVDVQFYKREVTRMNAEILALRAHIEKLQKEQVPADSTSSASDTSASSALLDYVSGYCCMQDPGHGGGAAAAQKTTQEED